MTLLDADALGEVPHLLPALAATLTDIRQGRLFLGSGSSRGNGRFGCTGITVEGIGPGAEILRQAIKEAGGD